MSRYFKHQVRKPEVHAVIGENCYHAGNTNTSKEARHAEQASIQATSQLFTARVYRDTYAYICPPV